VWLSIGIDYQYQSIDKLVSIGIDWYRLVADGRKKSRQIKAVIVNTLKVCSLGQSKDLKKWKVVASCLNRSCTFANNEIANNSTMRCCKIMNKTAIPSLKITTLIVL